MRIFLSLLLLTALSLFGCGGSSGKPSEEELAKLAELDATKLELFLIEKKLNTYLAFDGTPSGIVWTREPSIELGSLDSKRLPAIAFNVDKGKTLRQLPDAGFPFGLFLSGPGVNNETMKSIGSLPNLVGLTLNFTSVTDGGLKELKSLKEFKYLTAFDTTLTDTGIKILNKAQNLEGLVLTGCAITDAGLAELATLTHLKYLNLKDTKISSRSMHTIACFKNLTHLNLQNVPVTDKDLSELHQLKNLESIQIAGTKVTPDGANAFEQALPKCEIMGRPR